MNLLNRSLLIGLLVAFVGCDEPMPKKHGARHAASSSSAGASAASAAVVASLPPPDVFVAAPHMIQGCIGLYTYDSLKTSFDNMDVDKGKKILATKTAEFAYLRFHGKDVTLKYDKKESKVVDKTISKEVYKGNGFVVVLMTQVIQVKGEEMLSTGTLEISQGGKKVVIKVSGVSGC